MYVGRLNHMTRNHSALNGSCAVPPDRGLMMDMSTRLVSRVPIAAAATNGTHRGIRVVVTRAATVRQSRSSSACRSAGTDIERKPCHQSMRKLKIAVPIP